MIVQIYEIQDPFEAEKCIELGVDRIGSVLLAKNTWKDPRLKSVFHSTQGTKTQNSLIPLYQDMNVISKAIDYYRPHFIHFCDTLTYPDGTVFNLDRFMKVQTEIKRKFPELKIIRSIPIPQNRAVRGFPTLEIARFLEPVSDVFLTDTWLGKEPVEGYIGITGKTADWKLAKLLVDQCKIPVILAGGLSPENVYDALMMTLARGADSCTQTNLRNSKGDPIRFKKDFDKVTRFVKEVRRASEAI